MATLSKEEFMTAIKGRIGDDTSDEAMKFIEDMTDTFTDLEAKTTGISETEVQEKINAIENDWQKKYDTLDADWRDKYKSRFFEGTTSEEIKKEQKKDIEEDSNVKTFSDLFEEREG